MEILLHMLMGATLATACPQPATILILNRHLPYPAETAEVCFVRSPPRVLLPKPRMA